MLFEQRAALPFGHAAPYAELDPVVEGVGAALEDHRTMPADHCSFTLGGTSNEQFVGVSGATASLGHPGDAGLGLRTVD
jgi:hypothetical protein